MAVCFMMPILVVLVVAILGLLLQAGTYLSFALFASGFAVKLLDLACAHRGTRAGAVNGTSAFHVLTCSAMYLHYTAAL
jgi:hypothetical protein